MWMVNNDKKLPKLVQNSTRSWHLWEEMNFENLNYISFNEGVDNYLMYLLQQALNSFFVGC